MDIRDNSLLTQAFGTVQQRLPKRWHMRALERPEGVCWEFEDGDGQRGQLWAKAMRRISPSQLQAPRDGEQVLVLGYASAALQEACAQKGLGYVDVTGNIRLHLSRPGLFVYSQGAQKDPHPEPGQRLLRGLKAGRVVRALCEQGELGIRALAKRAEVKVGPATTGLDRGQVGQ